MPQHVIAADKLAKIKENKAIFENLRKLKEEKRKSIIAKNYKESTTNSKKTEKSLTDLQYLHAWACSRLELSDCKGICLEKSHRDLRKSEIEPTTSPNLIYKYVLLVKEMYLPTLNTEINDFLENTNYCDKNVIEYLQSLSNIENIRSQDFYNCCLVAFLYIWRVIEIFEGNSEKLKKENDCKSIKCICKHVLRQHSSFMFDRNNQKNIKKEEKSQISEQFSKISSRSSENLPIVLHFNSADYSLHKQKLRSLKATFLRKLQKFKFLLKMSHINVNPLVIDTRFIDTIIIKSIKKCPTDYLYYFYKVYQSSEDKDINYEFIRLVYTSLQDCRNESKNVEPQNERSGFVHSDHFIQTELLKSIFVRNTLLSTNSHLLSIFLSFLNSKINFIGKKGSDLITNIIKKLLLNGVFRDTLITEIFQYKNIMKSLFSDEITNEKPTDIKLFFALILVKSLEDVHSIFLDNFGFIKLSEIIRWMCGVISNMKVGCECARREKLLEADVLEREKINLEKVQETGEKSAEFDEISNEIEKSASNKKLRIEYTQNFATGAVLKIRKATDLILFLFQRIENKFLIRFWREMVEMTSHLLLTVNEYFAERNSTNQIETREVLTFCISNYQPKLREIINKILKTHDLLEKEDDVGLKKKKKSKEKTFEKKLIEFMRDVRDHEQIVNQKGKSFGFTEQYQLIKNRGISFK